MNEAPGSSDKRDPDRCDYHYDREERLRRLPPAVRARVAGPAPKGIFRKNRTLTIILIDIAVITLVWFVFLPLIRAGASGNLDGYSFSLHAFAYDNNALVTLKVIKEKEAAGPLPAYSAIFGLSSSSRSVEMQGTLPAELHSESTLRTSLPLPGKTVAVVCTVEIGAKKLSLKAKLQPES